MKLDRLASAQARLSEQERLLAGRPMPGSFRPKKPPEPRRHNAMMLDQPAIVMAEPVNESHEPPEPVMEPEPVNESQTAPEPP